MMFVFFFYVAVIISYTIFAFVRKKTFAIDIDGTITEDNKGTIHLDALAALRHLKETGHNVILYQADRLLKDTCFQFLAA